MKHMYMYMYMYMYYDHAINYSRCECVGSIPTQSPEISFLGKKILGLVYKCYRNATIT